MKKIIFCLYCVFCVFLTSCAKNSEVLDDSKIYFFYQISCPHCHDAAKYIKEEYPDLKMVSKDIKYPGNFNLFQKAVKKYNIGNTAGTPLICLGDKYIMGWSEKNRVLFDKYVESYLEK